MSNRSTIVKDDTGVAYEAEWLIVPRSERGSYGAPMTARGNTSAEALLEAINHQFSDRASGADRWLVIRIDPGSWQTYKRAPERRSGEDRRA